MEDKKKFKQGVITIIMFIFAAVIIIAILEAPLMMSVREVIHRDNVQTTTAATTTLPDMDYGFGDSDGLALKVSFCCEGPFMYDEDYWQTSIYSIHYDGTMEITRTYAISGERTTTTRIREADFNTMMYLAEKVMREKPYEDMDYSSTMDGTTSGFRLYDLDGEETFIYGGYTYGIEDLESIEDIVVSYGGPHI